MKRFFTHMINEAVSVFEIPSLPEDSRKEIKNWRLDKVRSVLSVYMEPMINLHFLNPYLKTTS
jgi:hypothetical protein